jgi:hypothetical protein
MAGLGDPVARKGTPPMDTVKALSTRLFEAVEDLKVKRAEAYRAEERLRTCVVDAFDAGMGAQAIREATGYTISRLYQIRRGTRL